MIDSLSFQNFYQEQERFLYNVSLRYCQQESLAMEFVHDAFLELWKKQKEIEQDKWRPYIYRVLINKLKTFSQRKKLMKTFADLFFMTSESTTVLKDNILNRQILSALDQLSSELKDVIALVEIAGLSYQEVALILGIPEGTVGSRRNSALAVLKESMGAHEA